MNHQQKDNQHTDFSKGKNEIENCCLDGLLIMNCC